MSSCWHGPELGQQQLLQCSLGELLNLPQDIEMFCDEMHLGLCFCVPMCLNNTIVFMYIDCVRTFDNVLIEFYFLSLVHAYTVVFLSLSPFLYTYTYRLTILKHRKHFHIKGVEEFSENKQQECRLFEHIPSDSLSISASDYARSIYSQVSSY